MPDDDEEYIKGFFGADMLAIRAALERLEEQLLESGQDEVTIATSRGSWTWQRAPN
jgi:hypothetical protein